MEKIEIPDLEEKMKEGAKEWELWQTWLDEFQEQTSPSPSHYREVLLWVK